MRTLIALFIAQLVFFHPLLYADNSQKRLEQERFEQAYARVKKSLTPLQLHQLMFDNDTAVGNKRPFDQIDFSQVVEVSSYDELILIFKTIRDARFLHAKNNTQFERRISWLYPDDGCFARAAMAGIKLETEHLIRPSKLYSFGELTVNTPYSPNGYVGWWYHVAPVVKYMGVPYVLDPAINANAPMTAGEWFATMGVTDEIEGTACNSYSYGPFDKCIKATDQSGKKAQKDQIKYLDLEWQRVSHLGFDPILILGANPPWLASYTLYG